MNRDGKVNELRSTAEVLYSKTGIVITTPTIYRDVYNIVGDLKIPFGDNRALLDVSEGFLMKTSADEKLFALTRGVIEQESYLTGAFAAKNSFTLGLATSGFGIMAAFQHGFAATYAVLSNPEEAFRAERLALILTAVATGTYISKTNAEKNSVYNIDKEAINIAGSPDAAVSLLKKLEVQEKQIKEFGSKNSWFKLENLNFKDQSLKEFLNKKVFDRIMEPATPSSKARIEKIEQAFSKSQNIINIS